MPFLKKEMFNFIMRLNFEGGFIKRERGKIALNAFQSLRKYNVKIGEKREANRSSLLWKLM